MFILTEKKPSMPKLNFLNKELQNSLVTPREGEVKAGEHVRYAEEHDWSEKIKDPEINFVIIGLYEDLGVALNKGFKGAESTFLPSLKAILNTQKNRFNSLDDLLVLGYVDLEENDGIDQMDDFLSALIKKVKLAGKTPIAIGGGHNNSYGMLKGSSQALNKPINCLNFDAHTDFRNLEHRHSGNGFSYAYAHKYLKRYLVLGIQENYTPEYIFEQFEKNSDLKMILEEDLFQKDYSKNNILNHLKGSDIGLEIDLDLIQGLTSSAMTPSGLSLQDLRTHLRNTLREIRFCYLHVCEGIIVENTDHPYLENQVPKTIAYLVTDFIKISRSIPRL